MILNSGTGTTRRCGGSDRRGKVRKVRDFAFPCGRSVLFGDCFVCLLPSESKPCSPSEHAGKRGAKGDCQASERYLQACGIWLHFGRTENSHVSLSAKTDCAKTDCAFWRRPDYCK